MKPLRHGLVYIIHRHWLPADLRVLFGRKGFSGQNSFVDKQLSRFDKSAIARNQSAGGKKRDISRNNFGYRNERFHPIAQDARLAHHWSLAEDDATVNELAEPLPISVQAVSKQLRVLERAGLITRTRTAQLRPSQIRAAPLKDASDWLRSYQRFWEAGFERLEERLGAQ